jgi:hypothetical protein
MNTTLTQEMLKEYLHYDPVTGIFTSFKNKHIEKQAFYVSKNVYGKMKIYGKSYLFHRLAWLYVYGEFPKHNLDHINGLKNDNRIANLRECTYVENGENRKKCNKNNKTGYLGVFKYLDKYKAQIRIKGKGKLIGIYDTPEQASQAYLDEKRKHHSFCTL